MTGSTGAVGDFAKQAVQARHSQIAQLCGIDICCSEPHAPCNDGPPAMAENGVIHSHVSSNGSTQHPNAAHPQFTDHYTYYGAVAVTV